MITVDPNPTVPWQGWTWCRVCGVRMMRRPKVWGDNHRCAKHRGRNPCSIEGCTRSTKAPETRISDGSTAPVLSMDDWFCTEHWRSFVPPRSVERRIYNRFWRRAKCYGWTTESSGAYWRFWNGLVRKARARASGDVDIAEINRVMGW